MNTCLIPGIKCVKIKNKIYVPLLSLQAANRAIRYVGLQPYPLLTGGQIKEELFSRWKCGNPQKMF